MMQDRGRALVTVSVSAEYSLVPQRYHSEERKVKESERKAKRKLHPSFEWYQFE